MRKHVVRVITHWALMTHIYVSMAGFTVALLFGVTGLTLNHPDFGGGPQTTTSEIAVDKGLLENPNQAALDKWLREKLAIRSPSTDYHDDPDQIQITFAAPGARTVVTIERENGKAEVEKENRGFIGMLNDLHKGLDSGAVWSWTIDVSALLLVISSLTGMVTLIALRARRRTGFALAVLGVLTVITLYVIWVPK